MLLYLDGNTRKLLLITALLEIAELGAGFFFSGFKIFSSIFSPIRPVNTEVIKNKRVNNLKMMKMGLLPFFVTKEIILEDIII